MSPDECIAGLDADVADGTNGEDVVLQRPAAPTTPDVFSIIAPCRANVTYFPGITGVGQSTVIMSPTGLIAAGWPGPNARAIGDPLVPIANHDKMLVAGRQRDIDAVRPRYVSGVLVRLELDING